MNVRTLGPVLVLLGVSLVPSLAFVQQPALVAGRDYVELPGGRPLTAQNGKVVVEEFFSYICPACNAFEPLLASWQARLPAGVVLARIPASFRADFVEYARAYYAAEALGLVQKTHAAVYEAIHRSHTLPAEGDKPDEERVAAFYARYGVKAQDFLAAMRSFNVDVKVRAATDYMGRCNASSTPSLVVNGRYLVRGATLPDMLRIASALVDRERAQ